VPQEDKGLQRSTAPNPNGWLTWHAPDSEQCHVRCTTGLSGVPIDSKVSQRLGSWLEAINTPPTTSIEAIQASHTSHSIQEQRIHSKDTIKAFNPLQTPKSNLVLSDLREGVLCFFCCSCCLDCFFLLTLILLSDL
jgi:hypothetical protein